jgi:hypothetical protein
MNHLTDPQKKDRPKSLSFYSDNTVTDDQQATSLSQLRRDHETGHLGHKIAQASK